MQYCLIKYNSKQKILKLTSGCLTYQTGCDTHKIYNSFKISEKTKLLKTFKWRKRKIEVEVAQKPDYYLSLLKNSEI